MIEINGEYGTGGGQILRTAVGLSALTGQDLRIYNIRLKRKQPGLKEQHLQGVNAAAQLCNAKIKGNYLGSRELEFFPGKIISGKLNVEVRTAGSIGLVLQTLLIPAMQSNLEIKIHGGATFGRSAPPVYYTQKVLSYFLNKIGYKINVNVKRDGFFPKGGAIVTVKIEKTDKLKPLIIEEKSKIKGIYGLSVASNYLKEKKVAERQAESAISYLKQLGKPKIDIKYSDSVCPGSGIQLWLETENSLLGGDDFGERGKRSEDIGKNATFELIKDYQSGAVDRYASDQLLPYLALSGGKILVPAITEHAKTNMWVIEKFLPVKFDVKGNLISVQKI